MTKNCRNNCVEYGQIVTTDWGLHRGQKLDLNSLMIDGKMWLGLIDGMLRWELQLIWGPFLVKAITDYNGLCHSFCKCNGLAKVPYNNYWFEWFRICSTKKLRRTNKWLLERSWNDGQSDTCRRSVRRNHFCTKKIILGSKYIQPSSWTCSRCCKKDTSEIWTRNFLVNKMKRTIL